MRALRAGIDDVFPSAHLQSFTAADLQQILCGERSVDWTKDEIKQHFEWCPREQAQRDGARWRPGLSKRRLDFLACVRLLGTLCVVTSTQ